MAVDRQSERERTNRLMLRVRHAMDRVDQTRLSSIFVLDQDEALDFYVGVLGLEVHTDTDLGHLAEG